jgi:hypothetical protein
VKKIPHPKKNLQKGENKAATVKICITVPRRKKAASDSEAAFLSNLSVLHMKTKTFTEKALPDPP